MAIEARAEPAVHTTSHARVAKNTVVYLVGQLVSWGVTFLSLTIIPRRLGEAGMGQLTLATTVVGIVGTVFAGGIEFYLLAEIGRDRRQTERLLRGLWGLRLVVLPPMAVAALLVLRAMRVGPTTFLLGELLVLATPLVYLITMPFRSMLAGWEEARRVSLIDLAGALSAPLAIPFLACGPRALPLSDLCVGLVLAGSLLAYARSRLLLRPEFDLRLWGRLVAGGAPFLINETIAQLYGFVSVFILRHFDDVGAVGEYNQALRIQGTLMFVPVALGTALLPALARLADTSAAEFRRMQTRVLVLMLTLALPVTATTWMLAQPLARLLYGPDRYLHVPAALQVCAFNVIPLYINAILYRFLVAQRKNLVWSLFMIATVGLNGLLCILLIPVTMHRFGNAPAGAVLASLIAEVVTVVFAFVLLRNNPINRETLSRIARSALAAAAMAAVLGLTRRWFIVVPALLGMATYVGCAWMLRVLGAEEQEKLLQAVRAKLGRA